MGHRVLCRCVRRAFLCGEDSFSGKSYEHRKGWVVERLRALQKVFAVDWAGRAVRDDKRGAIAAEIPPILTRLHIDPEHYLRHVTRGGRDRHLAVLGHVERLREAAERLDRQFLKGVSQAQRLYLAPT